MNLKSTLDYSVYLDGKYLCPFKTAKRSPPKTEMDGEPLPSITQCSLLLAPATLLEKRKSRFMLC